MNLSDYRDLNRKKPPKARKGPKVERKEDPPSLLSSQKDELTLPHVLACVTINAKAQHVHYDEAAGRIVFLYGGYKFELTLKPI